MITLTHYLAVAAILPCMVDLRTNLTAEVVAEIDRHFGRYMAKSFIRANVKLAEAPSFGRTIFEHAPDSKGAQDYLDFAGELLGEVAATAAAAEPAARVDEERVEGDAESRRAAVEREATAET